MTADRTAALLPPCFFAPAVASFALALTVAPALLGEVETFFYQPHLLALTHTLTLGWVSLTIQGVMYRYVPGLTKQPIAHPRLAVLQWATFVTGAAGLVASFWLGRWTVATGMAGLLVTSAVLLCVNLWPMLLRSPRRGVAEVGLVVSTGFLILAAVLGMLLAADKLRPLLGGSTLTNLAAHVHLAALGWVGTTIVALSFRFLPAFLLPTVDLTGVARRLVLALGAGVLVLAALLLRRSGLAWAAAAALAAMLLAYAGLAVRLVAKRRLPMDWTAWHAVASAGWVASAALAGVLLAGNGAQDAEGARLAAAYGVAGIVGWMSNLIIGVSYKLFPGFVAAARAERGRPAVPIATLGVPDRLPPIVHVALNCGVAATVVGLLTATDVAVRAGSVALAVAAALYAVGAARTLAFTVLEPRRPSRSLSVLP